METTVQTQRIIGILNQEYYISVCVEVFLKVRLAQGLSKKTLRFYQQKLHPFTTYCDHLLIKVVTEITPGTIRDYILMLQATGHNPGGCHAAYRTIRAFLLWWESEIDLENYVNPIKKVKAPKVAIEPLDPADPTIISQILATCSEHKLTSMRDKAIILALLDTGCRATEFLDIDLSDIDLMNGSILLRHTKGKKPRTVFISKPTRKAIRAYLSIRHDKCPACWISENLERLCYDGLRARIVERSKIANVKPPSLHSFRRLFALTMLRNGVNVYSLQLLMGHSDLQVLRRYLKETGSDLRAAHELGNPLNVFKQ